MAQPHKGHDEVLFMHFLPRRQGHDAFLDSCPRALFQVALLTGMLCGISSTVTGRIRVCLVATVLAPLQVGVMTEETFQGRADRLERRCALFAPPATPEACSLKVTPDSTAR